MFSQKNKIVIVIISFIFLFLGTTYPLKTNACVKQTDCPGTEYCDLADSSCKGKIKIGSKGCSAEYHCQQGTCVIPDGLCACVNKIDCEADYGADYDCISSVCAKDSGTPATSATKLDSTKPKMAIDIPGLGEWTDVEITPGQPFSVPWIAQYIVAIYSYGIIIGALLAVLMLIIGGAIYLSSGGMSQYIKKAKSIIFGALSGLVILMCSYLILYVTNPNLTKLGATKVTSITPIDYDVISDKDADGGLISGGSAGSCAAPKNSVLAYCGISTNPSAHSNKESLIQKFKDFSACADINYNILMGMCEHESGFRPGIVNCSCFKGLFQFKDTSMTGSLRGWPGGRDYAYYLNQIGLSTAALSKTDLRLFDDNLQIMGVVGATLLAKNKINAMCKGDLSKLSDGDIATLLYLKHNSGSGSLGNVLANGGCKGDNNIEQAFIKSWTNIITNRCKKNAFDKGKSVCTAGDGGYGGPYNSMAEAEAGGKKFGEGKARSVRKAGESRIIGKYKATNLFKAVPGAGTCPIKTK